MALATWKSGRMKNAKTKCAHRTKQRKMALLHCLTRDLIFHSWCKFPTATADFTSHNARAIYFVFFFFISVVFFSSVFVDNAGVHWLYPYLRRFWCIRLTASNIVCQQQTQAKFSFRFFHCFACALVYVAINVPVTFARTIDYVVDYQVSVIVKS